MECKGNIRVLEQIAIDMKGDLKELEGRPFSGETVGECFGGQGAAIITLANIVKSIIKQNLIDMRKKHNQPLDSDGKEPPQAS